MERPRIALRTLWRVTFSETARSRSGGSWSPGLSTPALTISSTRCATISAIDSRTIGFSNSSSATGRVITFPICAGIAAACSRLAHKLALLTQSLNAEADHLILFQVNRRLLAHSHTRRRTGGNDVAGIQSHELRNVMNKIAETENHSPTGSVLVAVPINLQPHLQILRIRNLITSDQPGTDRTKRVRRFSFDPLTAAFQLEHTF